VSHSSGKSDSEGYKVEIHAAIIALQNKNAHNSGKKQF